MATKQMARRRVGIVLISLVSGLLLAMTVAIVLPASFGHAPALAQRVRPEGVWQVVYERAPDLPKENQYVNKESGKVEADNTLVGRFIRYHLYVAGRSPLYRFDWKLTLADYLGLGLNGAFDEMGYPSRATLRINPAEGDRAAIERLTRSQRAALVQALTDAFAPQADNTAPAPSVSTPQPTNSPKPNVAPRAPGGAELLKL